MSTFDSLPTELLQAIFRHCSRHEQMTTLSVVCHRWAEAVKPLLLGRICLKVSYNTYVPGAGRFKLIDDAVLSGSDRPYSCFLVEWGTRDSIDSKETLKELLDVCQDRFLVQRLYLTAPPQKRLAQFFRDRHQWLQTLVELDVTLGFAKPMGCQLSFPSLKQLTWYEAHAMLPNRPFTLNAPELTQLNVVLARDRKHREDPDNRPLMSALEVKYCPKLENVVLVGHWKVYQRHVDAFEPFLRNLKKLSLQQCRSEIVSLIYEKCTSLKELTIKANYSRNVPLQISHHLLANLESLNLESCKVDGQLIFPRLRFLGLCFVEFIGSVSLAAPELTTLISSQTNLRQLNMLHKEQIRTLKLDSELMPPPPNVTELYLSSIYHGSKPYSTKYLEYFPNLVRLTLVSLYDRCTIDCSFLDYMPKLESFSARMFNIKLTDLKRFAGLKSMILETCAIKSDESSADVEQVQLTGLEYLRVERLTVDVKEGKPFPIQVNERQPPIRALGSSILCRDEFTSGNFKSSIEFGLNLRSYHFNTVLWN